MAKKRPRSLDELLREMLSQDVLSDEKLLDAGVSKEALQELRDLEQELYNIPKYELDLEEVGRRIIPDPASEAGEMVERDAGAVDQVFTDGFPKDGESGIVPDVEELIATGRVAKRLEAINERITGDQLARRDEIQAVMDDLVGDDFGSGEARKRVVHLLRDTMARADLLVRCPQCGEPGSLHFRPDKGGCFQISHSMGGRQNRHHSRKELPRLEVVAIISDPTAEKSC